jgi:hypothetical protein
MQKMIDALLDKNPEGLTVQVYAGGAFSGAIRKTDHLGIYEMKIIAQHPRTGQPMAMPPLFVAANHIQAITVLTDDMVSTLESPSNGSGLLIPGRRS